MPVRLYGDPDYYRLSVTIYGCNYILDYPQPEFGYISNPQLKKSTMDMKFKEVYRKVHPIYNKYLYIYKNIYGIHVYASKVPTMVFKLSIYDKDDNIVDILKEGSTIFEYVVPLLPGMTKFIKGLVYLPHYAVCESVDTLIQNEIIETVDDKHLIYNPMLSKFMCTQAYTLVNEGDLDLYNEYARLKSIYIGHACSAKSAIYPALCRIGRSVTFYYIGRCFNEGSA